MAARFRLWLLYMYIGSQDAAVLPVIVVCVHSNRCKCGEGISTIPITHIICHIVCHTLLDLERLRYISCAAGYERSPSAKK